MTSTDRILSMFIGDAQPIEIELFDGDGVAEITSGMDAATFTVREYAGATPILSRDTSQANLSISTGKLTATLSQVEADALTEGSYIGQIAVRFSSDSKWKFSELFAVEVITPTTPTL